MTVAINSRLLNSSPSQLQKIRDKYEDNSLWSKITKGPVGFSLYAALQYPKVFLNRFFFDNTSNPTWTVHQESIINALKWTFRAPLTMIRSNFIFLEYMMKHFGCSEPYVLLDDADGIEGYWLGPELWKGRHPDAIILYVHGGGYIAMSSFFGIRFLCYLIKQLRVQHDIHIRVLSIDYKLAPEEPFPSGLNCVKRAYKWLTEKSDDAPRNQNVFLCGDSSGASMILGLLQLIYSEDGPENPNNDNYYNILNDNILYDDDNNNSNDNENDNNNDSSQQFSSSSSKKNHPLAGVILISPWVELACNKLSCITNSKYDYLSSKFTSISAENYLFGKVGIPNRHQSLFLQPVNEPLILSWLEKVEDSFDSVGINDPNYYNLLPPPRSSSSGISKRYSIESRTISTTHNRFSMHSKRNSKGSYNNLGPYASPRNSKIRDDSSSSVMVNNYLNNNIKITTKSYVYSSSNSTNEEFGDLDQTTSTRKSSICHTVTLHQIIEKNKTEILRKNQITNDIYANPMVSPLHIKNEILAKFPPLFISYGGKEIFKDDIETFCKKCIESKNYFGGNVPNRHSNNHPDVTIETDPEMVHAYPIFIDAFGKHSKHTLNRIAGFISSKISSPRSSTNLSFHNDNIKRSRRNLGFIIRKSLTPTILLLSGDNCNDDDLNPNVSSLESNVKSTIKPNNNDDNVDNNSNSDNDSDNDDDIEIPKYLTPNKSLSKKTPNSRILRGRGSSS